MFELKTYNEKVDEFISKLCYDLGYMNIKFIVSALDYVISDNVHCNGCFEDYKEPFHLSIAVGKPVSEWFPILVHESCHFDQWRGDCGVWNAARKDGYIEEDIFKWIAGEPMEEPDAHYGRLISLMRDVELDCEQRTAKKIIERRLPIDVKNYIRGANAYVLFYTFMAVDRKWYKIGKAPYRNPNILSLMSEEFDMNYNKLSMELIDLFRQACV